LSFIAAITALAWWAMPTLHFSVNEVLRPVVDKIHSYNTASDMKYGVASELCS